MNRNRIRLSESQLHRVIKEFIGKVLNEIGDTAKGQYMLGQLSARQNQDGNLGGAKTSMYAQRQRSNGKDVYGSRASFQNGLNAFHNRQARNNGQHEDAIANEYGYYNKRDFQGV